MADVPLDTPIAAYGIPSGLMFDERPVAAYMRLSPMAPGGEQWWERQPVTDVGLPQMPSPLERDGARWILPDSALVAAGGARGLVTGQQAVNGAYVRELADVLGALEGSAVPWPPLCLAGIGQGLWVMDGNHRAAAAVLAGHGHHAARVVTVETLADCLCGWAGDPGQWLRHPCPVVTVR